ncbi:MAG: class I SAM-dependent rRNA methyltransferase [Myxococcales bacterium]|nr:class I SAM-dependent rRNA methyltransferase [Myxococcota bacterium]MDW8281047.1 class I SAM-dependent rRNA methyltransferase [Myxococcales bacterium]
MSAKQARLFLRRGRANPLWHGHPWVYSGAIERTEGTYEPGDLVEVCDIEGRLIGRGLANARSQIIVRMLTRREEPLDVDHPGDTSEQALSRLLARRLTEAALLRQRLHLPSPETDAYRLCNSEGDGLPGLIVDVYNGVAAVQFTTLGMKRREGAIYDALLALPPPYRPRAIIEVSAGGFARLEGFGSATRLVHGEATMPISCREAGVQLEVDPLRGQKTGMFLDQRDNRVAVGRLASGGRVLDVYSYAGGFALQALRHGAIAATCVDSSSRALERARRHAQLNALCGLEVVEADAFRFLESVTPRSFDVVIVDPPKFARAHKDLPAALKGYRRLNALALTAVAPGGLLATCSCSQLIGCEDLERVVAGAALDAARSVTLVQVGSQGPDHPVPAAFPEGRYLKFLLLGVR